MKIHLKPYKPAQIYQGKTEWYVYYFYLNPETGKWDMFKDRHGLNYKNIKSKPKARKELAEDLRDTYNAKLKAGWSPFGFTEAPVEEYDELKHLPVVKVLHSLNDSRKSTIKKRSYESYKYSINHLESFLKAKGKMKLTLETFTSNHAIAFFDWLMQSGKYKNKSINGHIEFVSTMFNKAIDRELIAKNPFSKIKPLEEEVGKNFAFTQEEAKKLKATILENRPELWLFAETIYHTFVRPLELLQVRLSDVNFTTGHIIIHSGVGKNKKQLPVEMPDTLAQSLQNLIPEDANSEWFLFGSGYKPGPQQMKRNTVSRHHSEMLDIVGLPHPKYSLYGWKHTGNVDAYNQGIDLIKIKEQNRHHSMEQTMDYLRSLGLRPVSAFREKKDIQ